jgi:rubrerythrin
MIVFFLFHWIEVCPVAGSFRTFIFRIILENAIAFEERSYRFYESALEKAVGRESRVIIGQLMQDELGHRIKLDEVRRKGDLGSLDVPEGKDSADIEAVSCSRPEIPAHAGTEEILEMALEQEQCSYNFYASIEKHARLKFAREVFSVLKGEEARHMRLICDRMDKGT